MRSSRSHWLVFRVDGRQPFRYAPERPPTGKVRFLRDSGVIEVIIEPSPLSLWDSIRGALGYGASALEAFFGSFNTLFIPPIGRYTTALLKRLSCQSALAAADPHKGNGVE